jgi:hypothetical protein
MPLNYPLTGLLTPPPPLPLPLPPAPSRQFAKEGGKEFRQCTMFETSWRSQQLLQRFLRFTPLVETSSDFLAILLLLTEMISNVVSVSQVPHP